MQLSAVSLMCVKSIETILFMVTSHKPIPLHLCDNGGGGTGEYFLVCFHHRGLRSLNIQLHVPIEYEEVKLLLKFLFQLSDRSFHREFGCLENIDSVYDAWIHPSYPPLHCRILRENPIKFFPLLCRKLF